MPTLAFHTQAPGFGAPDDPIMKGFTDRIDGVFDSAHNTEGFIGRYDRFSGEFHRGAHPSEAVHAPGHPGVGSDSHVDFYAELPGLIAETLSIWTNLESVAAFSYRGLHSEALSKRAKWFAKSDHPVYVAWWVDDDDDQLPNWTEAGRRLTHLHDHGPTPTAFDFKSPFDHTGTPTKLDRPTLNHHAKSVR